MSRTNIGPRSAVLLAFLLAVSATSFAQEPATVETIPVPQPAEPVDGPTELDTLEVTGSRIKRSDIEGPSPVAVISRDQIDKLGYTSVKDVLGNLSYNAGGSFDAGQSFSFARGTQSIDLRGFGAGRTLVLLDGRRLPVFPQGLGGTNAFVDLSTIPASLVERVEILLDGASAIYGSDAISGVVNIITRKNYTGGLITARASATGDGGGESKRLQYLNGFGSGETSFQLVAEYSQQDVLRFTDRDYSSSDFNNGGNGSSFGSNFIGEGADGIPGTADDTITPDPNCVQTLGMGGVVADRCRFDRSKFREWIPNSEKGSLYLRADRKLGDLDTFYRIGYYRSSQSVNLEHNPFSGGESAAFTSNRIYPDSAFPTCGDDPTTPLTDEGVPCPGYVPAGASNNPTAEGGFFNRRLVEFGQRGQKLVTDALSGVIGVKGYFGDYEWETGLSHNVVRVNATSPTILSSVFDNEVSNNGLDLFGPIPADVIARASHTQTERGVSRNTSVDGTISGGLGFDVWGGEVRFATHADYIEESYSDVFDAVSTNGDVFDGGSGGGGERALLGVGLELAVPLFDNVEMSVAGRFDDYDDESDTGSAISPSLKLGYRPFDNLLLRTSWGQSFRAPDLQRLFGATTAGFATVVDTPACVAAGGSPGTPVNPADPNDPCLPIQSVPSIVGSNPDLKEEEGENFNVGASWEILTDLNLTADYFEIKVEDLVNSLSAQQILDACAGNGSFCDQVTRAPNGTLGTPSAGGDSEALIRSGAVNLAEQEIHGYDLRLSYNLDVGSFGRLLTELSWSHLTSAKVRSQPDGPMVQQLKNFDTLVLPQDRQNLTTDWSIASYGATLRVDRVGRYPGVQPGLTVEESEFVEPFLTVGLQGRADLGTLGVLRLGVDNLLDEGFSTDPTFVPGTPGVQNQYVSSVTSLYSSPLGRQMYLTYEFSF